MAYQKEIIKVSEISEDFIFVSDSQDVEPIKDQFNNAKEYSGFFVSKKQLEHGEIDFVFGLYGSIPYMESTACLVRN